MKLLKISEMAKLNFISVQTLQFYEKIGIFHPRKVDKKNGYRYYSVEQSAQLDFIRLLKLLGFSLEMAKEIIEGEQDPEKSIALVAERIEAIEDEKKAVETKLELAHRHNKALVDFLQLQNESGISFEMFPARKVISFDFGENENIYEMSEARYEFQLRRLKKNLVEQDVPEKYFYNVGAIMDGNKLLDRVMEASELFVFIDDEFEFEGSRHFPASEYVVAYCYDFKDQLSVVEQMLQWVEKHGKKIYGPYISEVIYEPLLAQQGRTHIFLRLQIPVY